MKTKAIYQYLDSLYDFDTQEDWDHSGLLENHDNDIQNIVVALDLNEQTLQYCISNKIDLVITHHPLFTDPPTTENILARKVKESLIKHKINAIFLHTPFDKAEEGMNFSLAKALSFKNVRYGSNAHNYVVAELPEAIKLQDLTQQIQSKLNLEYVRTDARDNNKLIKKIAICGGSGGSFLYEMEAVDAFLTCDIKYHAWIDAHDLNLILIDVNHNVENIFVDKVAETLNTLVSNDVKINKIKSELKYKII